MKKHPDDDFVRDLVARTQRIELSPASSQRIARMMESIDRTLGSVASGPLFDTEPSQLEGALSRSRDVRKQP